MLFYILYRFAGFAGLMLSMAVVIAGAFWLAYKRCATRPYIAGVVTLAGAAVSIAVWGVRPQMFSLLLASVVLYLLDAWHTNRLSRCIWVLPLVMLAWVNLHGGYPIGFAFVAVTIAGAFIDDTRQKLPVRWTLRSVRPLIAVLGLSLGVVIANPNGWRLYAYPFATVTSASMRAFITEWQSPNFHLLRFQMFAIFLLATFMLLTLSRRTLRTAELILITATAYASLQSVRHIPFFSLVAIPILAASVHSLISGRPSGGDEGRERGEARKAPRTVINVFLALVVIGAAAIHVRHTITLQAEAERLNFPAGAVRQLREHQFGPNLFNAYEWGGYLIWNAHPNYRVYIDGRADIYGADFVTEFVDVYHARKDWRPLFRNSHITAAMIHSSAPLAVELRNAPGWQIAYEDSEAVIFTSEPTSP